LVLGWNRVEFEIASLNKVSVNGGVKQRVGVISEDLEWEGTKAAIGGNCTDSSCCTAATLAKAIANQTLS